MENFPESKWYMDDGLGRLNFENAHEMKSYLGSIGWKYEFPHGMRCIGFAYDKKGNLRASLVRC